MGLCSGGCRAQGGVSRRQGGSLRLTCRPRGQKGLLRILPSLHGAAHVGAAACAQVQQPWQNKDDPLQYAHACGSAPHLGSNDVRDWKHVLHVGESLNDAARKLQVAERLRTTHAIATSALALHARHAFCLIIMVMDGTS